MGRWGGWGVGVGSGGWILTRRTFRVQCCLREKRDCRYSNKIPLQVHKVQTNFTFQRTQPVLREVFVWKDISEKWSLSKPLLWFCSRHRWQIPGERQTVLGGDQATARDEEALPHLQRMGYFSTKCDAHLHGSWVHSHAHAWLHTEMRLQHECCGKNFQQKIVNLLNTRFCCSWLLLELFLEGVSRSLTTSHTFDENKAFIILEWQILPEQN